MAGDRRCAQTALVVENDLKAADLGASMLREFDLRVERLGSAREAIDRLCAAAGEVGLLLAKADLPGDMDGFALAERVSVLWPGVSVILTSDDPDLATERLPERATFVGKPWRALDLVAAAERAARADHSVHAVVL